MLADDVCSLLRESGVNAIAMTGVDSTQDQAVRLAAAGAPSGTVVVAAAQSAGRGRMGRTWLSPAGGLYASILFRFPGPPPAGLTVRAGIGVVSAVRAAGVAGAVLKWPNDCLVDGRKLCGILAESFPGSGIVVVGIGMNVSSDPSLAGTTALPGRYAAACLDEFSVGDPVPVCFAAIMAVTRNIDAAARGEPLDTGLAGSMLWTRGAVIAADVGPGVAVGVDSEGGLILRRPDGTIRVESFGEVQDAGSN